MDKKVGIVIAIFLPIIVILGILYFVNANKNSEETEIASSPNVTLASGDELEILTDEDLIKESLVLKNDWEEDEIEITVLENDGTYAKGEVNPVTPGEGGGIWFAKLVNGEWEIVWDGNGIVNCDDLEEYPDFPATLIPQCIDASTGELTDR